METYSYLSLGLSTYLDASLVAHYHNWIVQHKYDKDTAIFNMPEKRR